MGVWGLGVWGLGLGFRGLGFRGLVYGFGGLGFLQSALWQRLDVSCVTDQGSQWDVNNHDPQKQRPTRIIV